ncbi:MAG: PTS sugar transporter subunit IIB [Lachnospiraceae bacterium]|nr:PTS sugar transporter subunit IIB [Lachnospiraceae bacterium]
MLNILCVCHNGMGTSMLLKINVSNICQENGISATVEACAHGEALGFLMNTDIVLTSPEILDFLPPTDAKIVATTNMLNKAEVSELLVKCVKENFPDEIA